MRGNRMKIGVLIVIVLILVMIFSQYKLTHFSNPVLEGLNAISKDKKSNVFNDEQSEKVAQYFQNLEDKGYTNPTFEAFYAQDEDRLYVLVTTEYKENGHKGISYIVLDYDADGETIKNIITSGWIKMGETIKNF